MEEVRLGKSHADVEVAAWQGSHPASNEVLGDWRGGNRSKLHEVLGDGGSKRGKVGRGFFFCEPIWESVYGEVNRIKCFIV
jgi:hypothetical protein